MPKATPKIRLKLIGAQAEKGIVYFSDFRHICNALADCLKRSESIVIGKSGQIRYRISDMAYGSAELVLELVRTEKAQGRDKRATVVNFFSRQIAAIQAGKKVDSRLSNDDLCAFKKLGRPLKRRTKRLLIANTQLTEDFEQNVERIIRDTLPTNGFVSGRLERVNVHGTNEFVLFPPVPGYNISCAFPDELLVKVREAIKKTVTVSGRMLYAPDSPFPRSVVVKTMEIHPPDEQLPTLADLRGMASGSLGNMSAVEFVKSIRDD